MKRIERDLIGELPIPSEAYYGIHTQRALDNFHITGISINHYPEFIRGMAYVKWAAAEANKQVGILKPEIADAIVAACKKIVDGEYLNEFPCDMLQGGAGTSTNMNVNEVIANIALESLGYKKGDYAHCSPYDHVNLSQSTNDAYPTGVKLGVLLYNENVAKALQGLIDALHQKGREFANVMTMGRTHLQDAVPLRMGQTFEAWAVTLEKELVSLNESANLCLEINMGATAVGTGLNAAPGYAKACTEALSKITNLPFKEAENLVEATSNTGSFMAYSSAMKRLAVKLSKICNDLRLLTSGPRCGLFEINLPPRQAGSSIMPGKVNPVIAEVVSQTCFRVIGNDVATTFASEAGQLQLNVMEPVMTYSLLESATLLTNAMKTLRDNCIVDITVNEERCKELVVGSVGIVTALNPHIGYENSTALAQEALKTGKSIYDLVLEKNILPKDKLDEIFSPEGLLGEK